MTKAQLELLMAVAEHVCRGPSAAKAHPWRLTDLMTAARREHADAKRQAERITALEAEVDYYRGLAAQSAA